MYAKKRSPRKRRPPRSTKFIPTRPPGRLIGGRAVVINGGRAIRPSKPAK